MPSNEEIKSAIEKFADMSNKPEAHAFAKQWEELDAKYMAYGFYGGYTSGYSAAERKYRDLLEFARDSVLELANYYAIYDKHRPDREQGERELAKRIDQILGR